MKDVVYIKILAVAIAALAVFSLCVTPNGPNQSTGEIKRFASEQELSDFLQVQQENYDTGSMGGMAMRETLAANADAGAPATAPQAGGSEKGSDYSTTNIQVSGVDEADFVKNDGKYIYTISGSSVVITDAFPAEGMKIISTINLSGSSPSQIYINGDRLVVFGNNYNYYYGDPMPMEKPIPVESDEGIGSSGGGSSGSAGVGVSEPSTAPSVAPTVGATAPESKMAVNSMIYCIRAPCPGYGQSTSYIKVYDVSDHENPSLKRDLVFNGSYYNSRMVGDYIYTIFTVPGYGREIPVFSPYQRGFPDIYYFDLPYYSYQFTNVVSLKVTDDAAETKNKVFMLGYSSNMYVSENNIYLVYQKQLGQYYTTEKVLEVTTPLLPAEVASEINSIRASGKSDYRKYGEIQLVLQEWMQNNPQQAADLQQQISGQMEQIYRDIQKEQDKSVIQKISISSGNIDYVGNGEVSGMPLNQFSMDEHNGNFRIATTSGDWQNPANNLYVLNGAMNVVGKIEGLAKGERIFSARFMGDRAYLVTFVRIDPLFVIDLSDPAAPKVLGELKIPGVSDYLHPYDDNTIIGIGKNTDEIEGRVTFSGLKISVFDVTDVANPVEKTTYEIGGRGSYSEALYDHRAFMFSKSKNLLVLPVTVYEQKKPTDFYGEMVFNGAYAFTLTNSEITYKGRVSHANTTDLWSNQIRRSLYIDDTLYTVSDGKIKANSLSDFADISSVDLPRDYYYGGPYYAL